VTPSDAQKEEYRMTTLLEGIESLIRRNEGLSDNLSSTEIKHYAAEILNRLRHGSTIDMLEPYVRQLRSPGSRQFQVSPAAHLLAGRAFALFHSDVGGSLRRDR
jgi:hypothetical protein